MGVRVFCAAAIGLLLAVPFGPYAEGCTKLTAVGHPDWQPISYLGGQGMGMEGISYEIVSHIAKQLSIRVQFEPKTAWKRALRRLESGEVDAITGAFFSEERTRYARYTDSYMEFGLVAVVARDRTFKIETMENMIGLRGIATLGDFYGVEFEDFAKKHLTITRGGMPDQSMFEMIVRKRADFTILSDINFLLKSVRHGYHDRLEAITLPVPKNTTHILISKKSPCVNLIGEINLIIGEIRKGDMMKHAIDRHIRKITGFAK